MKAMLIFKFRPVLVALLILDTSSRLTYALLQHQPISHLRISPPCKLPSTLHLVSREETTVTDDNDDIHSHPHAIRRSNFFDRFNSAAASSLVTGFMSAPMQPAFAAGSALPSASEALEQLQASVKVTEKLLKDWDTISSGGGDAIRRELGTQGTTSPLFQIGKAVKVLQKDAEDPVAFVDASEEYLLGLGRADSMAYSANFAGGSGKPTPPAVYIAKSKKEVELIKISEKEMLEALGK